MKLNKKLLLVITFSSLILAGFLSVLIKSDSLNKSYYTFDTNIIKKSAINEVYEFIDFGIFNSQSFVKRFHTEARSIDYFFLTDVKTNVKQFNKEAKIDISEIKSKGTGTFYFFSEENEIVLEEFFNYIFNKSNYDFYNQFKYFIDEKILGLKNILNLSQDYNFTLSSDSFDTLNKLAQIKHEINFYSLLSTELDKFIDQYDIKNREKKDIIFAVRHLGYFNFLTIYMTLFLMTMISLCLIFYKKILNDI